MVMMVSTRNVPQEAMTSGCYGWAAPPNDEVDTDKVGRVNEEVERRKETIRKYNQTMAAKGNKQRIGGKGIIVQLPSKKRRKATSKRKK